MRGIKRLSRAEGGGTGRTPDGCGAGSPGPDLVGTLQAQDLQRHHHYRDERGGKTTIKSLFNTYIRAATDRVRASLDEDWLLSVFEDNAGVIAFNRDYNLVCKVETHNTPSALDPYGGALTGLWA